MKIIYFSIVASLLFIFIFVDVFASSDADKCKANRGRYNYVGKYCDYPGLRNQQIENSRLTEVLALSSVRQIKAKHHIIKLYSIPQQGSCVPETHWICDYHYYLAVSTFDEYPEIAVVDLGIVGEIIKFELVETKGFTEIFQVYNMDFSLSAIKANPKLSTKIKKYNISILENNITIIPQK